MRDYHLRRQLLTAAVGVGGAVAGLFASMVADTVVPLVQTDAFCAIPARVAPADEGATLHVILVNRYGSTRSGSDAAAIRAEALWWCWLPGTVGSWGGATAALLALCYHRTRSGAAPNGTS